MAKVAVIGAGPMGLAVAYQLVMNGHHPVVFESDDRVGGMAASFDFNGLNIERYYHFHCTSDSAFLNILSELGLTDKMHWVETKMGYWYLNQVQPWGNPIALLKFKGLSFIAKFRYGLHAFLATKRDNWKPLDGIDAVTWIRRWVGAEAYEVLWKKLFEYKFYHYTDNLSAAWIWSRVRRVGRSRYSLFREKFGYLEGGTDTLLHAMKEYIELHGGEVRLSSAVNQVKLNNDVVEGICSNRGFEAFDKIVSTVPLTYVSKMIPTLLTEIADKFNQIDNIAVVCVIVKLDKAVTQNFWLNVNDSNMDIPGLVEYSNLMPMNDHVVYVPFYMPGKHKKYSDSDDVFEEKVVSYLKKINPVLNNTNFIDIKVNRYRHAQPICPPRYLDNLPPIKLPIEGLFIADTSYYYPEDRGISESVKMGRDIAAYI